MFDAVTIGKATRDAFFEADFPLIPWPKTVSGKAYVLPFGEKLQIKKVNFTIGGNAANASATFARQGFKTACVATTGNDVSAEEIKRRLKEEGVETKFISSDNKSATSYSVLLLEKGERTILNYLGAGDSLSLDNSKMKKLLAKWWYVSLSGKSENMLKPMTEFCSRNNIAAAFNPTGYHIKHKPKEILSSLPKISFLVLNEEEAALLMGISFKKENDVFKKLDKAMPSILAITDGRNGVTVSDGKFIYKAGIFKEKKLADRTGAGDSFGSGFVAGLLRRGLTRKNIHSAKPDDICYAIRLAAANATSNVEKIGATEGLLYKNEFEKDKRWKNFKISVIRI